MKRLISILVIVALLVSICPAALADDDVEALKKRVEELEAEIEKKDAIIAEKDAIISALASSIGSKSTFEKQEKQANNNKNIFDDAIIVEEVKIETVEGSYKNGKPMKSVRMKIRNNYNPADGEPYADRISWDTQILDKSGDIVETLHFLYGGVDYGETVWDSRTTGLDLSDISAIRVKTYSLYQLGGSNSSTFLGEGKLTTPAIFPISEIEID